MPANTKRQTERRIAHATLLWSGISLSGIGLLGGLTIWHLVRRGRLLRESLGNPRNVKLPDVSPTKDMP